MSSVSERLRKAAAVRTVEVRIDGEKFTVKEVSATAFAEYGRRLNDDNLKASAQVVILQDGVVDEHGLPALTKEDAEFLMTSSRVATPLIQAIFKLSGLIDQKETDAS